MVPFLHEGGACVHAMMRVLLGSDRGCRRCGYVKDEDRYLTCNMSCSRLVDDVDDHVDGDVVVNDVEFVAVPGMGEGSRH